MRSFLPAGFALLLIGAFATMALAQEAAGSEARPLHDFVDGVPSGFDPAGNGIGFITWQDGSSVLELEGVVVDAVEGEAFPIEAASLAALKVTHGISSWGGFTHAFQDAALQRWEPRDLSRFEGIRFWFLGEGRGGTVQFDLFDNRNPELPGDSAERYAYRFVDDQPGWRQVTVPFDSLSRRTDFQPGGAPDDGLTLSEAWGWALGFPPGDGVSFVYGVEAYGQAGRVAEDTVVLQFSSVLYRVDEQGEAEIQLELSRPSQEAVSVRAFVQEDSAKAMRDIVARSELVVFPPGEVTASFMVRAIDDVKHEGDERASLTLGRPTGASLGFQRKAILVIEDDDPPVDGLLADFEGTVEPFEATGVGLRTAEILESQPTARPGQDRFEGVLVTDDAPEPFTVLAEFPSGPDWSDRSGVAFWYQGRGDGSTVTVTLRDDATDDGTWVLAFADEFDDAAGSPPNPEVWTPELGDGTANGIPGWGNNELQTYTGDADNVAHDGNGNLVIQALETGEDAPFCYHGGRCAYSSARIITKDKVEFQYGRIEARMKLPEGVGLWPAFWLLGSDIDEVPWPASGEIDIMEHVGFEPTTVHGTVHGPGYSGGDGIGRPFRLAANARFADDFHTFAVHWEPGRITWEVDGMAYFTLTPDGLPRNTEWVFDQPFFMILNLAVGGNWPGSPDASTVFPQSYVIDYVRAYERKDVAERFETTFVDDQTGWRRVELPFSEFQRASAQPDGAPEDGLTLERIVALEWSFEEGASIRLDDVRVID